MAYKFVDNYKEKGARNKLIQELYTKGIKDEAVLKAMSVIPRHYFFDEIFWNQAYKDIAFPIGEGQTISQPYTVAYQSSLLNIKPGHKVLEIGTGSGYQCSILCQLGADVHTIERIESLTGRAKVILKALGYQPSYYTGDGTLGLPEQAPFNRIIVTAGVTDIPDELLNQLTIGGYMIIPVGDSKAQKMVRIIKLADNEYDRLELETFRFVPLVGIKGW